MRLVWLTVLACLLAQACAGTPATAPPLPAAGSKAAGPVHGLALWRVCPRAQAEQWAASAAKDPDAALRAANCYAALLKAGQGRGAEGEQDADAGLKAALIAVRAMPGSAAAHYLAAYLLGQSAERHPFKGLDLVRRMEQEAILAARLDPRLDHGGPDRMLGRLYLQAPGFPISVGDLYKAVSHLRRAAALDPGFADNHLGLAWALLESGDGPGACLEFDRIKDAGQGRGRADQALVRATARLQKACAGPNRP
ncbi:MAG: hypothetical protein JW718_09425 [Desulfovibrionaceae bacterium]|nr:hypothetical protein [Desulfovibrionaceae bacterium]